MKKDKKSNSREGGIPKSMKPLCVVLTVAFCVIIVVVAAVFIITPKKEMSESENRVLAQRPILTLSSLSDGSFMKNFETWLSDQFPLRDEIIKLKTTADRITGKQEENGVYIGKNGFLFEKQTEFDDEQISEITDAMNRFSEINKNKINTAAVISPNSSSVLSDLMPFGVSQDDQNEQLTEIKNRLTDISWIDCAKAFESAKDKTRLFYRTDHHWTTQAAYRAFSLLMKTWKISAKSEKYKFYTVSSDFQGTLASSSGVSDSCDEIQVCVPSDSKHSYIVYYESSGRKATALFESEKLKQKNQYEVFLGGNFDKVVITTNAETDRTLLIFKDSYANCMIPMLTPHFSKIVVIDPRYFSGSLSDVMKEYEFTHAAYIYNLNTFLADTSLADVLES